MFLHVSSDISRPLGPLLDRSSNKAPVRSRVPRSFVVDKQLLTGVVASALITLYRNSAECRPVRRVDGNHIEPIAITLARVGDVSDVPSAHFAAFNGQDFFRVMPRMLFGDHIIGEY